MSALGQKRTSLAPVAMSALPPKADIARQRLDVRFAAGDTVPITECYKLANLLCAAA
jgi:hypothetical protein